MFDKNLFIQWILSKYFNSHLLFLNLDDSIKFAKNSLDCFIPTLIVMQELLHIPQSMSKLGLVYQGELVKFSKYYPNIIIDSAAIQDNLIVSLFD